MNLRLGIYLILSCLPLSAKRFRRATHAPSIVLEAIPEPKKNKKFTVHVLLEKKEIAEHPTWLISSESGFTVRDPYAPHRKDTLAGNECTVSYRHRQLWVDNKSLAKCRIQVDAVDGVLKLQGKAYAGSLCIMCENGVVYLVNSVDLEEYVCSVLRSESWPGWPLEVNKAFAIMQRSYVMAKVLQSRAHKKRGNLFLYDIRCTNHDQTYTGIHDCPILRQAVAETKSIVLSSQKKPIMAMYDTCCGGLIPTKMRGLDLAQSPYLARAYPCTFCTGCKVYSWKVTYTFKHCEELCKKAGLNFKNIQEMKVTKTDDAGIALEVKIRCGKTWHIVTGKKMYNIFKDIKSYSFSLSQHAGTVTFTGRGYGHHLGLCQWGARQMVAEGWKFEEILEFYYPQTTFMRVDPSKSID